MEGKPEREYELTDRQIISILFILMVVLGVMFGMGYLIGRASQGSEGSATSSAAATPPSSSQPARPDPAGAAAPPASANPSQTQGSPGAGESPTPQAASGAPASTTPVQAGAPAAPETKPATETKPAAQAAQPKPEPTPPKPQPPAPAASASVVPGTYLQVVAVKRDQAQIVADELKRKGYNSVMVPVEGQPLVRTLVGPLKNSAEIAKTKADLENLGFRPIVRKM